MQTQPQITTPAQQEQAPPPKPFDPDFKKMKASDFKLVQTWDNIVEQVKQTNPAIGCFLVNSKAYMCQNVLLMIVHNDFYLKKFKASGDATVLNEILKIISDKTSLSKSNQPKMSHLRIRKIL